MKSFAVIAAVCLLLPAAVISADAMSQSTHDAAQHMVGSSYGGGSAAAAPSSGGYGASIPAPPCPKNYLFSCQPSLSPAPCSQASSGGYSGSSGAYSESYPVYALPVAHYGGGYQGYNAAYQQH